MEELRRVQRNYGVAYANVLALAKQHGLDCPTVERLVHALSLKGPAVPNDADHMQVALQRAALAFRQVVDAVHKGWRHDDHVSGDARRSEPLMASYSLGATPKEDASTAG